MGMNGKAKMIVILVCGVTGLVVIDGIVTAERNATDFTRLQNVTLGMAEDDVVRIMGIKPIVMGADPREKEIFVWQRTTAVDSLLHWNQPTVGKTIKVQDGRVVGIRDDIIFR
jgi:hypothetical protein